jgi:hypothetical protein
VFSYTNADVNQLNAAIRQVRKDAGELEWQDHSFQTKHGRADFSAGDRLQFTGTLDKKRDITNGDTGIVQAIDGSTITVRLDGRGNRTVEFDAQEFKDFRHGYAGTIYKGQGDTLDQTYLYHSEHWRSAASYVALTRHRDKAELFAARNTAPDLKTLARQMARVDDRRAASHFHHAEMPGLVCSLTAKELGARFEREGVARRQQEENDRQQQPAIESAAKAKRAANEPGRPPVPGETGTDAKDRLARLLNSLEREDTNKRDQNQGGRTPSGRSEGRPTGGSKTSPAEFGSSTP